MLETNSHGLSGIADFRLWIYDLARKRWQTQRSTKEIYMVQLRALRSILISTAALLLSGSLLWAAEGIITKVADSSGKSCYLKFPAIREDTLFSNRPVLKDASEGDLIDFYGPCNHDPLGNEEVLRQRGDVRRQREQRMNSD
jgi:hypothetical protein